MAIEEPSAAVPGPLPAGLTRSELCPRTVEVLNRGNRRNPDVLLVEADGRPLVVKDFAPRGALVRATLGRWITAREIRAYRALATHPAVPTFIGQIDALAFAIEYRPGRRMSQKLAGAVPPDFVDRLERALDEMHRLGVAHLDLRHRSNVMLGDDGEPVLIDFGSAVCLRPDGFAARWILPWLARIDRRALEKWRRKLSPGARGGPGDR